MDKLLVLEKQGWEALSTPGDAGRNFYKRVLREDAVMLFPGGMRIEGRQNILNSLASQPWESFEILAPVVLPLLQDSAVLTYRVLAQREGNSAYEALISSTYVRKEGDWKLVVHQQTPI